MNNNAGKPSARRVVKSMAQAQAIVASYEEKIDERRKQGVRGALQRKRDRAAAAAAQAPSASGLFGY